MGSGRDTATAIGLLLEVIGLGVAVKGLASTHWILLQKSLPLELWRDGALWLNRIRGKRPPASEGTAQGQWAFSSEEAAGGSVRLHLPDSASHEEKVAYLMADVDRLWGEVGRAREVARVDLRKSEKRLRSDIAAVAEGLQDATAAVDRVQMAMAGRDGAGLRTAAVGLFITLCGVFVSVAGMHW